MTIFDKNHCIFLDILVKEDQWVPLIDADYTIEEARTYAMEKLAILQSKDLLTLVYPQPTIGRCKIALELFLISSDTELSAIDKRQQIRNLRN